MSQGSASFSPSVRCFTRASVVQAACSGKPSNLVYPGLVSPKNSRIMSFQSVFSVCTGLSNGYLELNTLQSRFLVFLSNPAPPPVFPHLSKWQCCSFICQDQKTWDSALPSPCLSHLTYSLPANTVRFPFKIRPTSAHLPTPTATLAQPAFPAPASASSLSAVCWCVRAN